MAITLEQHTINRVNNTLAMTRPLRLREIVDISITANKGRVPNSFITLDELKAHYEKFFPDSVEDYKKNFMTTHVYQSITWRYSQYNVVVDPRIRNEVLTTKPDPVFHGEVLRRLPEWTIRVEVADVIAEDNRTSIGIDMLVSRALVSEKDVAIVTLTTLEEDDITYRAYVLDLDKPTLLEAVLSIPEWNVDPIVGGPFDPKELGILERFMPCLLFVCSQFPTQTKRQGYVHKQNVKVKKKGKMWTAQAANKITTHCAGFEIANSLYEDRDYVAQLEANLTERQPDELAPAVQAEFIGEWDDPDAEDPTFHYDWIPPIFDEKNKEENPS